MKLAARLLFAMFFAVLTVGSLRGADSRTTYTINPGKSKIEIQVAKEGFFKAFGHDHLVSATLFSGSVQLAAAKLEESSVTFTAQANSLHVVDPGESEKDRSEVQATMLGEHVLDVARYPQIQFASSAVKVVSASKNTFALEVSGTLTLHGTQKSVTLPVRVQISDDGSLTCDTEVSLLQSAFGIAPYKAGGGAVKVKDKLKLTFHIVAAKASSSPK